MQARQELFGSNAARDQENVTTPKRLRRLRVNLRVPNPDARCSGQFRYARLYRSRFPVRPGCRLADGYFREQPSSVQLLELAMETFGVSTQRCKDKCKAFVAPGFEPLANPLLDAIEMQVVR